MFVDLASACFNSFRSSVESSEATESKVSFDVDTAHFPHFLFIELKIIGIAIHCQYSPH